MCARVSGRGQSDSSLVVGFDGAMSFSSDQPLHPSSALPNGTFPLMRLGSSLDKHQPGNRTAYDAALRRAYVISHIWGYKRGLGDNTTTASAEAFCLEANGPDANSGGNDTSEGGNSGSVEGAGKKNGAKGRMASSIMIFAPALVVMFSWTS